MREKLVRAGLLVGLLLLLTFLSVSAAAEELRPGTLPTAEKPASLFHRERSTVTLKTIYQPFKDLNRYVAESMGWEEGVRAGFEESIRSYFTAEGLLALLGFGLRAAVTLVLAFLLWKSLSPALLRARGSLEEKPGTSAWYRWGLAGARFGQDLFCWGLVALAGSLVIWFFDARQLIRVTAVSILLSIAGYRVIRSALKALLTPESSRERPIRLRDGGARHIYRYLKGIFLFAALWLPVLRFFDAINYHDDFQSLLWIVFRLVIFLQLIILIANKQLIVASIPTVGVEGRRISYWVQTLYPALVGLVVGMLGLYSLGFIRLAHFILASVVYSLAFLAGALALLRRLRRLQRAPLKEVEPEEAILPVAPDQRERVRGGFLNVCVALTWVFFALILLSVWGVDLSQIRRVATPLTSALFTVGETNISLWVLIQVALVLAVTLLVSRSLRLLLRRRVLTLTRLDIGAQHNILSILHYIIIGIGIIVALQTLGLHLTTFTVFAGVVGIGIGFGLQNIANNFISGIILLMERTIRVGDFIDVAGTLGIVDRIGARCTTVRTLDNISVLVPNSSFITERVVNWSHASPVTRLHVEVGVMYGSDTSLVEETLLAVGKAHPLVLASPPARVLFTGFKDSALGFDLLVWTAQPAEVKYIISDLNFAVDRAFREKGITIPFPQRDLHLRSAIPIPFADSVQQAPQELDVRPGPRDPADK